jgi:hypothetical protein
MLPVPNPESFVCRPIGPVVYPKTMTLLELISLTKVVGPIEKLDGRLLERFVIKLITMRQASKPSLHFSDHLIAVIKSDGLYFFEILSLLVVNCSFPSYVSQHSPLDIKKLD